MSSGEVYVYDRTCAHVSRLARTCGRPGLLGAQQGATADIERRGKCVGAPPAMARVLIGDVKKSVLEKAIDFESWGAYV